VSGTQKKRRLAKTSPLAGEVIRCRRATLPGRGKGEKRGRRCFFLLFFWRREKIEVQSFLNFFGKEKGVLFRQPFTGGGGRPTALELYLPRLCGKKKKTRDRNADSHPPHRARKRGGTSLKSTPTLRFVPSGRREGRKKRPVDSRLSSVAYRRGEKKEQKDLNA